MMTFLWNSPQGETLRRSKGSLARIKVYFFSFISVTNFFLLYLNVSLTFYSYNRIINVIGSVPRTYIYWIRTLFNKSFPDTVSTMKDVKLILHVILLFAGFFYIWEVPSFLFSQLMKVLILWHLQNVSIAHAIDVFR